MTIVEMRDKRAKLWATMQGFLDTHRTAKGVLTAEDDNTYNNMEKELNDLTNEIRRMERRDAIEAELKSPWVSLSPKSPRTLPRTNLAELPTPIVRTSVCICAASSSFTMFSVPEWTQMAATLCRRNSRPLLSPHWMKPM